MKLLRFSRKNSSELLTVKIPALGKLSRAQRALELSDYLATLIFYIFGLFLPLSGFIFSEFSIETSSFIYVLISVIALFGLYMFQLGIAANKRIVDPYGLFTVLIFALVTTTTAILVKDSSSSNTFGSVGANSVKGFAGLAVITYILVYYYIILFLKNSTQIKRFLNIVSSGFVLLVFVSILFDSVKIPAVILVAALPFFAFTLINSKRIKLITLLSLIIVVVNTINTSSDYTLFRYSFSLFIPALFSYIILFSASRITLKNDLLSLRLNFSNILSVKDNKIGFSFVSISNVFRTIIKLLVTHSFIIFALFIVILVIRTNDVLTTFETPVRAISSSFKLVSADFLTLLSGFGSGGTVAAKSQFASLIEGHGILGLMAYFILFIFGLYSGLKIAFDELQGKTVFTTKSIISIFAVFNIVFLTILSFFSYVGYLLMILWLINFGIVCTLLTKHNFSKYSEFVKITSLSKKHIKAGLYTRYLLSVISIAFTFFLIYSVLEIAGNLI